jgi:Domain of unknown function (DUF6456)
MNESSNADPALKTEIAALLAYLSLGAATVIPKNATTFTLTRKGSEALSVSAKALTHLAMKNWVRRDGKVLVITDKAPATIADWPKMRETVSFELVENNETRSVTRLSVESPIDYLASRKDKNGVPMLGKAEWIAGDRLRTDFTRANMLPAIGMRWGEPIRSSGRAGGSVTPTDAALDAKKRVDKALEAVGPEFSGLLIDVCCFLKGLEQVEMERGWPQRSAKLMVRAGLSILARHYTPLSKAAAKTRAWGADGFRPSL